MNRSKLEQLKRQDYIGLFLFSAGLILFVLGLSWGGNLYPWKSARVISTIVVGSVTLIVFGLYGTQFPGSAGKTAILIELFEQRST